MRTRKICIETQKNRKMKSVVRERSILAVEYKRGAVRSERRNVLRCVDFGARSVQKKQKSKNVKDSARI